MRAGFCVYAHIKEEVDARMEAALASPRTQSEIKQGVLTPAQLEERVQAKLNPKRVSAFFSFPGPANAFIELAQGEASIINPVVMYCSGNKGEKAVPFELELNKISGEVGKVIEKRKIRM